MPARPRCATCWPPARTSSCPRPPPRDRVAGVHQMRYDTKRIATAMTTAIEELRIADDREASFHPGWGRTPEYTGWRDEQLAWKRTCSLGDWSFLWDVELSGRDALRLLSDSAVNSMASFDVGQAKHLVQCNDDGKVIAEGVLLRLAEDRFATQSTTAFYTAFLANSGQYNVEWRHRESFQYQVGGPNSLAVVEQVV